MEVEVVCQGSIDLPGWLVQYQLPFARSDSLQAHCKTFMLFFTILYYCVYTCFHCCVLTITHVRTSIFTYIQYVRSSVSFSFFVLFFFYLLAVS